MYLTSTNNFFMEFLWVNKKIYFYCASFLLIFLINVEALTAQPFSYLELTGSVSSAEIFESIYVDTWTIGKKISFTARTPYYIGDLGIKGDYFVYKPFDNSLQKITALNVSAGFSKEFSLFNSVSIRTGIGTGVIHFSELKEMELFYRAQLEQLLNLNKFSLVLSFELRRIYNYNIQTMLFYGLGVQYRLDLPKKIQAFIK